MSMRMSSRKAPPIIVLNLRSYFREGIYQSTNPGITGRETERYNPLHSPGQPYKLKSSDRVVRLGIGAYAEYTPVHASKVHIIPSGFQPGIAAASLLHGLTALTLISKAYHVQKYDWVVVHFAAGRNGALVVSVR
ncbi:hypothetical protein B7494_g8279 [Chlorociboria aeruginascens]|nr:hypothetical protein B7494_g8279 [Chlorociboria aeruginascens]